MRDDRVTRVVSRGNSSGGFSCVGECRGSGNLSSFLGGE